MRPLRRSPTHDPEKAAARYVDGSGGRRWSERFEAHLLDCEDCWQEVTAARAGRSLAERARELAPASLREDIRANVLLSRASAGRRRAGLLGGLALVMVLAAAGSALLVVGPLDRGGQPQPIHAALTAYRSDRVPATAPERAAPDLSPAGLRLVSEGRESLHGISADVFRFVDAAGDLVVVFLTDRTLPEATEATQRVGAVHGWRAEADGIHMVCADDPVSYLVLGASSSLVGRAEVALRAQL